MISKLYVENFLSIEDIELENLNEMDTVGISGQYKNQSGYSNGSGKSSLAESIWYAFTGSHRYKKDLDVVRIGSNNSHILLEYIQKDEKVTIERFIKVKKNRDGTKTSCIVKYDYGQGEETVSSGTKESQIWINKYFGITEDAFIKSFFFRQKEYDKLMKARSADRLKFIEDFLGASVFDKAKKLSAKKRNELDIEIKGIDVQIETLEEKLLGSEKVNEKKTDLKIKKSEIEVKRKNLIDLESSKEDLIKRIAEAENKLANVQKDINERNKIKKEMDGIKAKGRILDKKKKNSEKFVDSGEALVKELKDQLDKIEVVELSEDIDIKLDKLKNKRENLLIGIATEETELKNINNFRKHVEIGDCPTCFRQIDEKLMKSLTYKYDAKIKRIEKQIQDRKDGLKIIDSDISQLTESIKSKEKIDKNIKNLEYRIKVKETELKGDKNTLKAFKEQLELLRKQFKNLTNKFNELKDINDKDIIIPYAEKEDLEKVIGQSKYDIKDFENVIQVLQKEINDNIEVKKNISELSKKRKSKAKEISYRIKLDSIFDKCRMEIISIGLKELENDSTDIISNLGATQKEIVWRTQKETLSGNIRDSLDIYLIDEKGERPIEGLSGGEWDLTAFSTRAALARYKLSRMNSKIDFMILDEIFGALDEGSQEELVSVINMFKEEFSQVFVISHTNLKESFGHNIKVEMNDDGITKLI